MLDSSGLRWNEAAVDQDAETSVDYWTALQRPCSSRAGYTVIPHSSSITGPPPLVAARPVPLARTLPRAIWPAFGRPRRTVRPRRAPVVGILRGSWSARALPAPWDSLSSCVVAGKRADDVSSEWLPR